MSSLAILRSCLFKHLALLIPLHFLLCVLSIRALASDKAMILESEGDNAADQHNFDGALNKYNQAVKVNLEEREKKGNHDQNLTILYIKIGNAYWNKHDPDKAFDYYLKGPLDYEHLSHCRRRTIINAGFDDAKTNKVVQILTDYTQCVEWDWSLPAYYALFAIYQSHNRFDEELAVETEMKIHEAARSERLYVFHSTSDLAEAIEDEAKTYEHWNRPMYADYLRHEFSDVKPKAHHDVLGTILGTTTAALSGVANSPLPSADTGTSDHTRTTNNNPNQTGSGVPQHTTSGSSQSDVPPFNSQCVRVRTKWDHQCGSQNSFEVVAYNTCPQPSDVQVCLEKSDGKWQCGTNLNTTQSDGSNQNNAAFQFVCSGTGRYKYWSRPNDGKLHAFPDP